MGSIIKLGPFDVLSRIGHGGMAVVFEGVHRAERQKVAIKVVTSQKARQERYRRAFRNEVQNVARLNHPHIVDVLDVGQLPEKVQRQTNGKLVAGSPYLVMKLIEGGTLSDCAPDFDWFGVKRFLTSILDALAHAHARRVIHRDLKPDNVLIDVDARGLLQPKMTDFGIARALDQETFAGKADVDEWITGTPKYMAPESIRGLWREQGPWTDLYGLGCIAWWLCAGRPPFWNGGTTRILQDHVYTPPPQLEPVIAVPGGFEHWLRKMLAKSPADRFQHAADAAYSLLRLGAPRKLEAGSEGAVEYTSADGTEDATKVDVGARQFARGHGENMGKTLVFPVGDPDGTSLPTSSESVTNEAVMALGERAPFFPSWRLGHRASAKAWHLSGAGLGLFGLRTIPMIDREPSRTLIWDMLRQAQAEQRCRLLVVRGPFGCGKSRLCEWMCQRAHELGCAEYFTATHSPNKGPLDGLGPMLSRFFRCAGQKPGDLVRTMQHKLLQYGIGPQASLYLARALGTLVVETSGVEHGDDFSPVDFSSPQERYAVVARLFRIVGRRRPLMVWLDDVHWSPESLYFAEHLLTRHHGRELPALVLMTVRSDLVGADAHVIDKVAEVLAHDAAQAIELGPLAQRDHRELVRTLLGLDEELTEQVAERTQGNPLFAVQLVGDWVDRGLLEVGESGFVLAERAEAEVPDDIYEMWRQRLDSLFEHFDAEARPHVRQALELAAVLGLDVSNHEWRNVCVIAGISPPEQLVDLLCKLRLARQASDGWSFAHAMLGESLQRAAQESGRLAELNRWCARMLAQSYHEGSRGIAERRAMHLVEAGEDEAALGALLKAANQAHRDGLYDPAQRLVDERDRAIERLDLSPTDRRIVQNRLLHAKICIERGHVDEAYKHIVFVEVVAESEAWSRLLCQALMVRAVILRRRGALPKSLAATARARELLASDDVLRVEVLASEGFTHIRMGNHAQAMSCFEEAVEFARSGADERMTQRCLVNLIFINIQQGEWDDARHNVDRLREMVSRTGTRAVEGHAWNALGEIARFHEQWDAARQHYRDAADIWGTIGHINAYVARCNLALVELANAQFVHADEELRQVRAAYAAFGYEVGLPLVDFGIVACAAAQRDWERFDRVLSRVQRLLDKTRRIDRELAWLAELAADVTQQAGQVNRADTLYELAEIQWRELDEPTEANAISAKRS